MVNSINVSARTICKKYSDLEAVRSVSFELKSGEITGLIGPNGAGKTTIIRLLGTLIKPDEGSIIICGIDASEAPGEVRKKIGVMPENSGLYQKLNVYQNLQYYTSFYDIHDCDELLNKYIEEYDLVDKIDVPTGELSKGMKEKISFIRAVIHDPEVIILDEPFTGMDPDSRITLKKTIESLKSMGKTIMLSSHDLAAVEAICDKVILLDKGAMLIDEYIQPLKERFKGCELPTLEDIYISLRQTS